MNGELFDSQGCAVCSTCGERMHESGHRHSIAFRWWPDLHSEVYMTPFHQLSVTRRRWWHSESYTLSVWPEPMI